MAQRGLQPDVAQRFGSRLVFARILRTSWLRDGRHGDVVRVYEDTYPTVAQAASFLSAPLEQPQICGFGELPRAAVDLAHARKMSGDEPGTAVLIRLVRESLAHEPRLQFARLFGPGTADAEIAILEGRNDDALAALERVVDTGWIANWRWEIEHNPIFDAVRDDVGYRRIIDKLEANTNRQRDRLSKSS